ncbi:hypothetical protein [Mycolicibacter sinensis]
MSVPTFYGGVLRGRDGHRMTASNSRLTVDVRAAVRSGGVLATALAGVLGAVGAPPLPVAGPAGLAVALTSAESGLTPAEAADALALAQQQAVAVDSALPHATPEMIARFPDYVQMLTYYQLQAYLAEMNPSSPGFRFPYMPHAVGGNPISLEGDPNPDNIFNMSFISPEGTYVFHYTPGAGTVDFNITPQLDFSPTNVNSPPLPAVGLDDLTPNPDGSYTITISPTPQPGNWIDSGGATGVWVRNTIGNWAANPGTLTIDRTDIPLSSNTGYVPLSESGVASLLDRTATDLPVHNLTSQFFYTPYPGMPVLENGLTPVMPADVNGSLPGQYLSIGGFDLQPGQALIIKEPTIAADYHNIQLFDSLTRMLPFQYSQTSLNNFQAVPDADGNTYYVISDTNPGVPNWLDTTGILKGGIFMRFQGPTGALPSGPFEAQVVPVDSVRDYLPADTPTVTPEEFAEQLALRAASFQHLLSASKDTSWITQHLVMDDIKAAIGVGTFDDLFGTQDATASLAERVLDGFNGLDPMTAVENILTNPIGSLDAVFNALPYTVNEIGLAGVLAMARAAKVVGEVAVTIGADISSGRLTQVFPDLAYGTQALAAVLQQTIFDPTSSLTAGLLNARDDLTFALVTGVKDTSLSQLFADAHNALTHTAAVLGQDASLASALIGQMFTLDPDDLPALLSLEEAPSWFGADVLSLLGEGLSGFWN